MLNEAPDGPLHGVPIAVKDMFTLPWRAPRDGAPRNLQGFGPGRVRRLPAPARRRRGDRRRHQHARVRCAARPVTCRPTARARPRGTRRAARAGRPAGRAPPSPRGSSPARSAPTAAARSATPPPTTGSPGLKHTWGTRATGRLHPRARIARRTRADVPRRRRRAAARRGARWRARSTSGARRTCASASCRTFWEDIDPEVARALRAGGGAPARERHDASRRWSWRAPSSCASRPCCGSASRAIRS